MLSLTLFHDGQYWIAIIEIKEFPKLKAFKKVFGIKPSNKEIFEYLCSQSFPSFKNFLSNLEVNKEKYLSKNPKKRQKQINKEKNIKGRLSKAFKAVKLEQEMRKKLKKKSEVKSKKEKEQKKYAIKKQKRNDKRKGH